MTAPRPQRRWGGTSHLVELLEGMPGGMDLAVRDFALITLASQLAVSFPEQLVFKGGFVLRHVHGLLRFSKDVDATRHEPPERKLDADEVAAAIRQAGIHNVVQFSPNEPATDSVRSLDFDEVHVVGETFPNSSVQVEISYREAVVDAPIRALVGAPFYDEFEVLAMTAEEMAAEKLRTLAQRLRPTDLADLAVMMQRLAIKDANVAHLAVTKFELVAKGQANRIDRIERHLGEMADTYDDVVPALFPGAPSYREAMEIAWPRIKPLVP